MTVDSNGQGLIDFSKVLAHNTDGRSGRRYKRPSVNDIDAVPENEIRELDIVRIRCGLTCAQIARAMGLNEDHTAHGGFVSRVLGCRQKVNRQDFTKMYLAVAKFVFRRVLDA